MLKTSNNKHIKKFLDVQTTEINFKFYIMAII